MKTLNLIDTTFLVSFGNFILSKQRMDNVSDEVKHSVTDADLANWKHENNIVEPDNKNNVK